MQALYRKYRPKKLDEVLGQETNIEILRNAAATNRLGQAYIFFGARGTGKTTVARLLAKLLNCEKRRDDPEFAKLGEPCNECRECLAIDAQNSFDVIEIDAASNRGIDEIRNLKENIRTAPTSAQHKVYIIDECLTEDHLISLADGTIKTISQIQNGEEVVSTDTATGELTVGKVSNFFSRETDELIYIRTPQATIKCTPTHRMWVMRQGSLQLVQARDICSSDFFISPIELPHAQKNTLTPDQLSFIALIQCDGHVSKDSATIQVEISKDTEYFIESFKKGIAAWKTAGSFSLTKTKRGTVLLRYYSPELKKVLLDLNCPAGKKSDCIDIPDEIFQAPLESIRAYIDTAFCCEGDATFTPSTRLYKLSFSSNSEVYSKKLQLLLKKFGISSGIMHISKTHLKNHNDHHRLNITGYDLRLFQEKIGLSIKRKAATLKGQLLTKEKQDGIPLQIPFLEKRKLFSVTDSALRSHGVYLDKTQSLSRTTVQELISIFNTNEFNPYLNFRYEKILSIEAKHETAQVYDFTVEGNHTFFANGICSSNCHMLTGAAFNALLKTLEEPPAHAVIVLATTEYEKLPATITSRAQRFTFKKLSKAVIMEKLQMMARAEKIKIDDDALELIAAAGEGSLRDAESLLGQIASLSGTGAKAVSIDLATAERVVGRTGLRKVHELAELIIKKDLKGALAHLAAVEDEGHNLIQFTKDLIHYLRKVLSLNINPALEKTFEKDLTHDEIAEAKRLGAATDPAFLIKIIKALIRAYAEMRYSPFAIVPLEIAFAEQLAS